MNKLSREPMKKDIVFTLLTRRLWLMPILYHIHSYGEIGYDELKQLLCLRTQVLKRALWWLVKYGVVERRGNRFRVVQDYRVVLSELFLNKCIYRNYYIFRYGETYFVSIIRRTRITAYTVPAKLLADIDRMKADVDTEFKPTDLLSLKGIPLKLAYRVVKIHRILRECTSK